MQFVLCSSNRGAQASACLPLLACSPAARRPRGIYEGAQTRKTAVLQRASLAGGRV